ncbi:MAG: ABC transporter substrate-binding protein [Desulfurococcales archaeon]|nr:ABC transporter substrate-binding protein [Desulfurococcales archaeon]
MNALRKSTSIKLLTVSILLLMFLMPMVIPSTNTQASGIKKEIKIALFQPRTAAVLNFYGTWAIQGFHLGLEYATGDKNPSNLQKLLNGQEATYTLPDNRKIIVKVFDTQGKPDVAIARAREAIEDWGANILAGTTFSSVAAALAPLAKEYQIPFFVFPAAAASITQDPIFNKYVFRIARNTEQDALAMIDFAVSHENFTKFAFIAADYEFGWSYIESIQYALSKYPGTRIVDIEWVPLTTTDFRPYIERAVNAKPDALGIIWAGDFSVLYKDLASLGVLNKIPILALMIDMYSTNFVNFCIPGLSGILENLTVVTYDAYVPNRPGQLYKTLQDMMKKEDIHPFSFLKGQSCEALNKLSQARIPDLWHPPAFATAQFIVDAVKAVPDLNVDRFIAYLEGRAMETPMGFTIIRPQDHQALRPYYIVKYVKDTDPNSDTYGLLIGSYIKTIPPEKIAPRILTSYKPYPKNFTVSIVAPKTVGVVPFEVKLSVTTQGGTPPFNCTWNLGNGETATGLSITHTYQKPGIFHVNATCYDYLGIKASAGIQIVATTSGAFQTQTSSTSSTSSSSQNTATATKEGISVGTVVAVVVIVAVIAALAAYWYASKR